MSQLRPCILVLAAIVATLVPAARAWAQDVVVRAELSDRRVFVGQALALDVVVEGSNAVARPQLPDMPGFEVAFVGEADESRSSVTIINGVRREFSRQAYRHRFQLTPLMAGELAVPPIRVTVGGKQYETGATQVRVVPPQPDPEVKLWLSVDNPEPYVGEPVRLRVTLGLLRTSVRLVFSVPGLLEDRFGVIEPDSQPGRARDSFNLLGVEVPVERGVRTEDGQQYVTFTAERIIIPRRAGEQTIGPATVDAEVEVRPAETIFDRRQTRRAVVPSDPLVLRVRPLPEAGKPANFNGLIGRYSISASASPLEVSVGDPISLEIRVNGPLVRAVPEPALERQNDLSRAFRVTGENQASSIEGGARVFKRTLRVAREDVSEIPAIELPYFDTSTGKYVVARSAPIPLTVRPTRVVTAADAVGDAPSGANLGQEVRDRAGGIAFNYEGPALLADQSFDLGRVVASPLGLVVIAGPPAAYAALGVFVLARRRGGALSPAQRRKRGLAEARSMLASVGSGLPAADIADMVSAAVRRAVGAVCGAPAEGLTPRDAADALARAGDPDLAARTQQLLESCDAARYGGVLAGDVQRWRDEASQIVEALGAVSARGGAS